MSNNKTLEETILFGCCMNEYDAKGKEIGHRTRSPEEAFIDFELIQDLLSIQRVQSFNFIGRTTRSGYRSKNYMTMLDIMEKRIEKAIDETTDLAKQNHLI